MPSALDRLRSTWDSVTEPVRPMLDFVVERWTTSAEVDAGAIIVLALATLAVMLVPRIWAALRQASTIIHEMGHVLTAWATGRRVSGIKLHSDTSGVTISRGNPHGIGVLVTTLAGYPAPGLLAAGMAWLAASGYAGAALTAYQAVVLVALLLSRNLIGIVSSTASLAATGVIWWYDHEQVVAYTVVVLAVFYAVAGVRGTADLIRVHAAPHRRGIPSESKAELKAHARTTDAGQAATAIRMLPIPAVIWLGFFTLVSLGAVATTVWLLAAV